MFKSLTKIFGGRKREHIPDFEDPVLGKMCFTGDGLWGAHLTLADKRIGFVIGGHTEPSSVLLAHARDIVRNFAEFESMIFAFLADEGRKMTMTPDEIRKFEIAEVILCWPEKELHTTAWFIFVCRKKIFACGVVIISTENRKDCGI